MAAVGKATAKGVAPALRYAKHLNPGISRMSDMILGEWSSTRFALNEEKNSVKPSFHLACSIQVLRINFQVLRKLRRHGLVAGATTAVTIQ